MSHYRISTEVRPATNTWTTFWWYPSYDRVCRVCALSKNTPCEHSHEHSQCVIERTWSTYYQTRLTKYRIVSNLRCQRFDIYRIAPWYVYERFNRIRNWIFHRPPATIRWRDVNDDTMHGSAREIYRYVSHTIRYSFSRCACKSHRPCY